MEDRIIAFRKVENEKNIYTIEKSSSVSFGDGYYFFYPLDAVLNYDEETKKLGYNPLVQYSGLYGNIIVKYIISSIDNFLILDYKSFIKTKNYQKLNKKPVKNFIIKQLEYFNIEFNNEDKKNLFYKNPLRNLNMIKDSNIRDKVKGIIYKSKYYNVYIVLSFQKDNILPFSYSTDNGKTFNKIENNLINFTLKKDNSTSSKDPEFYNIHKYEKTDKGLIIYQDVKFKNITRIPFKIYEIFGNLEIDESTKLDLRNFPNIVHGNSTIGFFCSIDSFESLPDDVKIDGAFKCFSYSNSILDKLPNYSNSVHISSKKIKNFGEKVKNSTVESLNMPRCSLESLENHPNIIKSIDVSGNKLKNLNNFRIEKLTGNFNASFNQLEDVTSSLNFVGGDFNVSENKLKTFKGLPKYILGNLDISLNDIEEVDEKDLPEVKGKVIISGLFKVAYAHNRDLYKKYINILSKKYDISN